MIDREAVTQVLAAMLAGCAEQAAHIAAEDYDALSIALEAQQRRIDALNEMTVGSLPLTDAEHVALFKQINDANDTNTAAISGALATVADAQRTLQKGMKGVAAYTRAPISEDGSFVDQKG